MPNSVLFVGNFLSASGTHRTYCEDMADHLEARNWTVVRTSHQLARLRRLGDMLSTTLRRRREFDVVHIDVFSGPAFLWAELVALELDALHKPYVLTLRGGSLPRFAKHWPRRMARLLRAASSVTAPSGYLRESLAHCRDDIEILPNAIETADYQFRLRTSVQPRLIWLRAFHNLYNPQMAIDVLADVRKSFPTATLRMVGADKGDGSLAVTKQRAIDLGVADAVELVAGVPKAEVPAQLEAGDIFLNTTDVDNTPVSVIEAMACGLPVVSTNVDGLPYLLTDGHNALLVPKRDRTAMSEAVLRVLAEPILAAALSRNARAHALACDWSVVVARWEQLFKDVRARG